MPMQDLEKPITPYGTMKMLLHLQQMKKTPKWGTLRLMTNLTRTWRKYHAHHRLQATSTWYA
jgi:hypothetical protein